MNVLRVIASMDPATGGPCQGIRNSIPSLQTCSVYNEVVCLDDPHAAFIGKDNFKIIALGKGKGPWCYNEKLMPWLLSNLHRFDHVIIHGLWLYPSFAASKAIKKFNKKASKRIGQLVMPHGMLDPYFQQASGRKLKAIRNWLFWKLIERKVIENASMVLFTTQTELELARTTFTPYHPKREVNVGYGIQPPPVLSAWQTGDFFTRHPQLLQSPYILFLSRVHQKKGVDLLLKAYKRLHSDISKGNLVINMNADILPCLVIAGPGMEEPFGKGLAALVSSDSEIAGKILFTGMLTGDDKWSAYYGCQAFILPSHQENFGIAVAEALACGKPVLISDKVNIWREIIEGGAGMAALDTEEGVYKLLLNWIALPANQKSGMARLAGKCFENKFTSQAAASSLYANLVIARDEL